MAGQYQHPLLFQAPVQLFAADGKAGEPQPQEDGAFGLVNVVIHTVQFFFEMLHGEVGLALVIRFDNGIAQAYHFPAADQVLCQRRPHVAHGQAEDAVHLGHDIHHFFIGDNDARARARQPQLGQAHAQDDVVIPEKAGVGKNDVGERHAVGIVDDQGNTARTGDVGQPRHFLVREDVPGGVGWP